MHLGSSFSVTASPSCQDLACCLTFYRTFEKYSVLLNILSAHITFLLHFLSKPFSTFSFCQSLPANLFWLHRKFSTKVLTKISTILIFVLKVENPIEINSNIVWMLFHILVLYFLFSVTFFLPALPSLVSSLALTVTDLISQCLYLKERKLTMQSYACWFTEFNMMYSQYLYLGWAKKN